MRILLFAMAIVAATPLVAVAQSNGAQPASMRELNDARAAVIAARRGGDEPYSVRRYQDSLDQSRLSRERLGHRVAELIESGQCREAYQAAMEVRDAQMAYRITRTCAMR